MIMLEPRLPPELEREIFRTTAFLHPGRIPTLLLVAQRVKIWVEPFLYQIVVFTPGALFDGVLSSIKPFTSMQFRPATRTKPRSFFRDHVRHLCIGLQDLPAEDVEEVLSSCSDVTNLLLFVDLDPRLFDLVARMPLQRLCTDLRGLFAEGIDLTHPLFTNITHFDIIDSTASMEDWAGLALLPSLTHLAFNDDESLHAFRGALENCKSLLVLVVLCHPSNPELSTFASDVRFVVVRSASMRYRQDWQRGARGGTDYWRTAESFIARRRSGNIDPLCFAVNHAWDAAD
ncbi:hypothetical protein B0H17DRAFT_1057510 [Mycena rosella]|uniref:Uncharacterized protein n=1 Tax=Mycena rosella TaxID=1033263 RepID=A0AAD7GL97_MYCRO|nr:hypothetical protein B0H17DRAFT_1057510 [Mycena rosella]